MYAFILKDKNNTRKVIAYPWTLEDGERMIRDWAFMAVIHERDLSEFDRIELVPVNVNSFHIMDFLNARLYDLSGNFTVMYKETVEIKWVG